MSSSAVRGAVLVALAALVGFLVLQGVADLDVTPIEGAGGPIAAATPDPDDSEGVIVAPTSTVPPISEARPNSEVVVLVANGTDVIGQAGRLTDSLRNQGFNTRQPQSADTRATSVIYFRPGFASEARVVQTILNQPVLLEAMPEPDPVINTITTVDLVPINVLVVIGADELSTGSPG